MTEIPAEAISAAATAIAGKLPVATPWSVNPDVLARAALEATWPHLAAAGFVMPDRIAAPVVAAAERERSEALIAQAQDYARAESERADKVATLAREILTAVTPGDADDAPEFTEWRFRLEQLEGAAGEMSPPDSDPLEDAYQTGILAERERIRQLALAESLRILSNVRLADADFAISRVAARTLRDFAALLGGGS